MHTHQPLPEHPVSELSVEARTESATRISLAYTPLRDADQAFTRPCRKTDESFIVAPPQEHTGVTVSDYPPDPNEMTHRALLAGIARKDESALAAFYDASAGRVYALALRIAGTPQAAEEVAADVYWQVWNQAQRYDPARGKVMAWLMTLCRSRALDHLRREQSPLSNGERHDVDIDVADECPSPLDIALALERNSAMRAALLTLDSNQRQLLSLAFFRGLSHQEIATYTGLPLGSVKSAIRKAMLALKEILSRHDVITTEGVS